MKKKNTILKIVFFETTISNHFIIRIVFQKKDLTRDINYVIVYTIDMVPYHLKLFMGRKHFFILFFISLFVFFISPVSIKSNTLSNRVFLEKIQFSEDSQNLIFNLSFSSKVEFITYELDSPSSIILDILGGNVFSKTNETFYELSRNGIDSLRIIHYDRVSNNSPVDLIMIELSEPGLNYSVMESGSNVRLVLENLAGDFTTGRNPLNPSRSFASQTRNANSYSPNAPLVQPLDYDPDPRNVFVVEGTTTGWQLWFENTLIDYKPLHIAQEQVNLAKIRVRNERRNLFPNITLQGSETIGTTGVGAEDKFQERRYGLGIEQPLTYGGELRYKLDRALVNLDIAKMEYNRIRADYLFRVKEAYFRLLAPKVDLINYSRLLERARQHANLLKRQYDRGLVTRDEYLRMESLLDQIYFQVRSTVEDLEVAKVNFRQVLNLDMNTDIEIHPDLRLEKVFVDKSECLRVAINKRPELKINKLVVDFNQYNREIAKSKERLRVSLSGFLGQKGSNYTTEPLVMEEEWSLGLRISKPFGTSTATTSLTTQTAPPSLSQAGAEADTHRAAFELSLMDKMDILTENKSAHIEYMKSVNELANIRDTIFTDVKTAYADYRKSLYQIENSSSQIDKEAERLSILRSRWQTGEADLSNLLQAELRVADQKSSYNRGLVSYYISLSNLAKACGMDSFEDLYHLGAVARLDTRKELASHIKYQEVYDDWPVKVEHIPSQISIRNRLQGNVMALGPEEERGFVIINVGKEDGVRKGMSFIVYREGVSLGEIKVVGLRNNSASCMLTEEIARYIQLGDKVIGGEYF